jgi:CspA family cold shock protein
MSAPRFAGTVKFFNEHRGFGFINSPGRGDFFVHVKALRLTKLNTLAEGQAVTFEIETHEKGDRAVNVKLA